MTNQEIIIRASKQLAESGIIKYTGRQITFTTPEGEEVNIKETEAIHTYKKWQELGFQVQKGQKAIAKIRIWKYTTKKDKETEKETATMFLKNAAFFSRSQVEAIA